MSHQKNINLFDYLTIEVQKVKLDRIVNSYECFGWKVLSQKQHDQYENIIEVEFYRNHFIANKDELQFLQVNMEADINSRGRLESRKHLTSIILGITLGLLVAFCGVSLALCLIYLQPTQAIIGACVFGALTIGLIISMSVFLVKIFKKENAYYAVEHTKLEQSILNYCNKAKTLLGDKYE